MFMTFVLADGRGNPTEQKVCLNIKNIWYLKQLGEWRRVPLEVEPTVEPHIENEDDGDEEEVIWFVRRGQRRAVGRNNDAFFVFENCVKIVSEGDTHDVMYSFDELSKMLESLNNLFE